MVQVNKIRQIKYAPGKYVPLADKDLHDLFHSVDNPIETAIYMLCGIKDDIKDYSTADFQLIEHHMRGIHVFVREAEKWDMSLKEVFSLGRAKFYERMFNQVENERKAYLQERDNKFVEKHFSCESFLLRQALPQHSKV